MSVEEARLFALAKAAFDATAPSSAEVSSATRRISARRAAAAATAAPAALVLLKGAAIVACAAAAIAFAGRHTFASTSIFEPARVTLPPSATDRRVAPLPAGASSGAPSDAPSVPASADTGATSAKSPSVRRAAPLKSTAKPNAASVSTAALAPLQTEPATPGWSDVDRALSRGDVTAAEQALEALSRTRAAGTHARLGLAQLALSRGDCRAAVRHLDSIAEPSAADAARVAALRARCRER